MTHSLSGQVNEAAEVIYGMVDPEADLIFGAVIDSGLDQDVSITLIATGFGVGAFTGSSSAPFLDQKLPAIQSSQVKLDRFMHLSPLANDFWWIAVTGRKALCQLLFDLLVCMGGRKLNAEMSLCELLLMSLRKRGNREIVLELALSLQAASEAEQCSGGQHTSISEKETKQELTLSESQHLVQRLQSHVKIQRMTLLL